MADQIPIDILVNIFRYNPYPHIGRVCKSWHRAMTIAINTRKLKIMIGDRTDYIKMDIESIADYCRAACVPKCKLSFNNVLFKFTISGDLYQIICKGRAPFIEEITDAKATFVIQGRCTSVMLHIFSTTDVYKVVNGVCESVPYENMDLFIRIAYRNVVAPILKQKFVVKPRFCQIL
jgi:hypothetical protein